jgi:hypothetical protein
MLPPSHEIIIKNTSQTIDELRTGATGFIIHLIGCIYGMRMQFQNWQYDGRVYMQKNAEFGFEENELQEILEKAVQAWEKMLPQKQQDFTNLLYMHTRLTLYEWTWERFMIEYAVLDGCWRFYWGDRKKEPGHGCRISTILKNYGMKIHDDEIKQIVELRKGLFHEVKWANGMPCYKYDPASEKSYYYLKEINLRLFFALLDFKANFISTDWKSYSSYCFN